MILVVGEILFDLFPGYRRLGGAAFNFAFHLKKLGMPVKFVSRIGKDGPGEEVLDFLENHGFDPQDVQIDAVHPTGSVCVSLDGDGTPDFIIQPEVAYDHIRIDTHLAGLIACHPRLLYFGTLTQRTRQGHEIFHALLRLLAPDTRTFYDINLRPDCYFKTAVLESLKQTDILKLNREECDRLSSMLDSPADPESFLLKILREYAIEIVVLTLGPQGSRWISRHGRHHQRPNLPVPLVDSVGAGDAFAAMTAIGYLKNWSPEKILDLAQQFATRICGVKGALPENNGFYESFLREIHG